MNDKSDLPQLRSITLRSWALDGSDDTTCSNVLSMKSIHDSYDN